MTNNIRKAICNLVNTLLAEAPETTVEFRLCVNCEGSTIEVEERTAETLRNSGISMRNLRGAFIKPETTYVK